MNHVALFCALVVVACRTSPGPTTVVAPSADPETPTKSEQADAAAEEDVVAAKPIVSLQQVGFEELPGWSDDHHAEAIPALRRSCQVFLRRDAEKRHGSSPFSLKAGDWKPACTALKHLQKVSDDEARAFFETHLVPVAVGDQEGEYSGRFTGYYDPLLRGSKRKRGAYRVPVYARPPDLISVNLGDFYRDGEGRTLWGRVRGRRLKPYPTRSEIEKGALKGRGLELLWIDDPVSVFFAQVQGSAQVVLSNGKKMRLAYAGKNGRKYLAIGRKLVEEGHLESGKAGLPEIRKWLEENPKEAVDIMRANDGFVFFDLVDSLDNKGAMAVPLTAERSIAVDRRLLPLGAPLWLDTILPDESRFRRVMVAQDTGGAIRGAVRGDIYFGAGERAENMAGHLISEGRYFLLLPKQVGETFPRDSSAASSGISEISP